MNPGRATVRTAHRVGMAAHLLLFDGDGQLLVIRRGVTGYLDGYWSVPAGHIEPGETAAAACARETAEEVGLVLDPAEDLRFALVQMKSGVDGEERVDFFFTARPRRVQVPRIASPREVAGLRWVLPDALPEPFAPYVFSALDAYEKGRNYSTWGL